MHTKQSFFPTKLAISKMNTLLYMRFLLAFGLALEVLAAYFFSSKLHSPTLLLTFGSVVLTQCLALTLAFKIRQKIDPSFSDEITNNEIDDEQRLQSALQSERSRLSSQVAHDIKSPLTALEILSKEIENTNDLNPMLVSMTASAVSRIREISTGLQN